MSSRMETKWSPWALLGPTLVILEGPEKGRFLNDCRSAKSADKSRWSLALGRPRGPKSPTQLRQGSCGGGRFGHLAPQGGARARA